MNLLSFGCCIALLLPMLVACGEERAKVAQASRPAPAPLPEGPKRDANGNLVLGHGDFDDDGFPNEAALKAMPERDRLVWESWRTEEEKTEAYMVFEPPRLDSDTYRRSAARCAPVPSPWVTNGKRLVNACNHCTTPAAPLPKCGKQPSEVRALTADVLRTSPTEVVSVRARLGAGTIWSIGTAHRASYSTQLLLRASSPEDFKLYLLLDTEHLSKILSELPLGPWITQAGSLFCSGDEEMCCPFDFGPRGEFTDVVVTGRVQALDEFYPDDGSRAEARGLLRARNICRP